MSKQTLTRRTQLLLVLLILAAGYDGYQQYQIEQQSKAEALARVELANSKDPSKADNAAELRKRLFMGTLIKPHPSIIPVDSWQKSELARTSATLADEKYDYIVLPIEQNVPYYDRVTRLMAARRIADTLREATGKRVMSPELALRAMEKRSSNFADRKVASLAHRVGAKVVRIFLDLNRESFGMPQQVIATQHHSGRVYIVLSSADGHILNFYHTQFHDNAQLPCEMIFADMAPTAVKALVHKAVVKKPSLSKADMAIPDFPDHIDAASDGLKTPLDNAVYMQLFAMLTPKLMQYERRRLFERSLMALHHVDKSTPYYNLLTARALFYLYRRPEALKHLSQAKLPSEMALREYLNGNYPQLAALVPRIDNPVLRAMAYLDLKYLGYAYDKTNAAQGITLPVPTAPWSALLTASGHDGDIWYAPDNVQFFADIKGLFPAFDKKLVDDLKGRVVSGTYDSYGQNYAVFNSLFTQAFTAGGAGCCAHYGDRLETADIWSLYHNIAVANLLRKLHREIYVYGSYSSAKTMAESFAPWLQGNSNFMSLYASALNQYSKQVSDSEKEFAQKEAFDTALLSITDSNELDVNSNRSVEIYYRLVSSVPHDIASIRNTPFCSIGWCDYPSKLAVDAMSGWPDALPYENMDFTLLRKAAQYGSLDDAELDIQLETRFDGAPKKTPFLADRLINSGHNDSALALLQKAAATKKASWEVYDRLGELMIDKGEYAQASKMYMTYQGFSDPPSDFVVETGNRAYEAGAKLYWLGRYRDAMPLLEVSAKLDTGSARQYLAIKDLALTQNDYATAAAAAYQLAQRYNSASGFRDYLTILHLVGLHDQSEAAFRELAPRFSKPYLWKSIFVGQRMEKKPFDDIATSIINYASNPKHSGLKTLGAQYLAEQAMVDRTPSDTQARKVAALDTNYTLPSTADSMSSLRLRMHIEGATASGKCDTAKTRCTASDNNPNPYSSYEVAGFLYAYALLREGKYSDSVNAFLSTYRYFPTVYGNMETPALPYFAMALSADNQSKALSTLLTMLDGSKVQNYKDFDEYLTRAIAYAGLGRYDDSLNALVMAHRHYSHNIWRPADGWYLQLVVAESIYHKSHDTRFIDKAVEWAKDHEVIQPQDAWAYAFVARYGKKHSDRIRSAAFAEYLDPQSAWLSQVPEAIRRGGEAWWPEHNPFKLPTDPDSDTKVNL